MEPIFQLQKPRHRRQRHPPYPVSSPPPPPPPPPASANITQVTASFGEDQTYWHFDQPLAILPGATWEMFTLVEDGGPGVCVGVGGVLQDATTLRIQMDTAPLDSGNGWFYELVSVPAKVKTTSGGEVNPGGGDVLFT